MEIKLGGDASSFGWFIIAIAVIMTIGIYVAHRKGHAIKLKYVAAVIIMLVIGIKWLLDN